MTEQEAHTLVARLTRIWKIDGHIQIVKWLFQKDRQGGYLSVYVDVTPDFLLSFFASEVIGRHVKLGYDDFEIEADREGQITEDYAPSDEPKWPHYKQIAVQWMPFFRRNCWLSGCDIEASAHEKAEWIQGFTREEIEAWNLKM